MSSKRYPLFYGSHYTDFSSLGEIHSVSQIDDTVVVKTDSHYLLYAGRAFGSLSGRGWKLVAAKDLDKTDVSIEDISEDREEDSDE